MLALRIGNIHIQIDDGGHSEGKSNEVVSAIAAMTAGCTTHEALKRR